LLLPETSEFTWIDLYMFVISLVTWLVMVTHIVSNHWNEKGAFFGILLSHLKTLLLLMPKLAFI